MKLFLRSPSCGPRQTLTGLGLILAAAASPAATPAGIVVLMPMANGLVWQPVHTPTNPALMLLLCQTAHPLKMPRSKPLLMGIESAQANSRWPNQLMLLQHRR
jgi:hypothetical protein